ncbi:MAG: DUF2442 domain-containing protein [bacterium]
MNTSTLEMPGLTAGKVAVSDESLIVELSDGRVLSVPLAWYPRLLHGSREERSHWRLIGRGAGIHWPDLDEDLSVEGLLRGAKSGESRASLSKWLVARQNVGHRGKRQNIQAPVNEYNAASTAKRARRVAEGPAIYGKTSRKP